MVMIDPFRLYIQKIAGIPHLKPEEERKLWSRIKKGDALARRKLTLAYLKLVIPIAKRYYGAAGMDILDVIEEGNLGLMHAVEKYKIGKRVKFSTYATYWIEQAVGRAAEEQRRTIRIPPHIWHKIKKWLKQWEKLNLKYGRRPSLKEIGKALKVNQAEVKKILSALDMSRQQTSFDAPIDEDESVSLGDTLASPENESKNYLEGLDANANLEEALEVLEPRDRKIVTLRYGLYGGRSHTLGQIADKIKVSKERVRQILDRADKRMKSAIKRIKFKKTPVSSLPPG
ncbi:MAG: RNA polymerase subunit sigma [Elusimicrobia bacterium HGW-Elusimicrobia-1]|jgi:RNA polymerase primary sigma factor|nr:MAG: RNA polymerase subunit sigma [Elusimicrobia bacterium HGW-Elusimicrobia-1]